MEQQEQILWEQFLREPTEEHFAPLYDHTKGLVYTISLRYLLNEEDAFDAFQNAYARLVAAANSKEKQCAGKGMARLAVLEADALRKRRNRRGKKESAMERVPDVLIHPTARIEAEAGELRAKIEALAALLPEEQRVALMLHYFDGLSHQQIAEALDVPRGTVTTRLRVALKKLGPMMRRAGLGDALPVLTAFAVGAQLILPPAKATAAGVYTSAALIAANGGAGAGVAAAAIGLKVKAAFAAVIVIVCVAITLPVAQRVFSPAGSHAAGSMGAPPNSSETVAANALGSNGALALPNREEKEGGSDAVLPNAGSGPQSGLRFGEIGGVDDLTSGPLHLAGTLHKADPYRAAPDVELIATLRVGAAEHEQRSRRTRTDAEGRFAFKELPIGTYEITALAGEYRLSKSGPAAYIPLFVSLNDVSLLLRRYNSVSGIVRNRMNNEPVAGVTVSAAPFGNADKMQTAISDEEGKYRITGIVQLQVVISARGDRYVLHREENHRQIIITFGNLDDEKEQNILVTPVADITGQVTDARGRPVSGARLEWKADKSAECVTESDAAGHYRLRVPVFTTGSVRATYQDQPPVVSRKVALKQEGVAGVDLVFNKPGVIEGIVLGPDGNAVGDVEVKSYQDTPYSENSTMLDEFPRVKVNSNGAFRIENVTPTRIHMVATGGNFYASPRETVTLAPGETKSGVTLRMREGKPLAGRIVDDGGKSIKDAIVNIMVVGSSEYVPHKQTGDDGAFRFTGLPAGQATLSIHASNHISRSVNNVTVGNEDVVIVLKKQGEIENPLGLLIGTVVSKDSGNIIDIFTVKSEAGFAFPGVIHDSGAKGLFTVPLMTTSAYRLLIEADGYAPLLTEAIQLSNDEPEKYMTFTLETFRVVTGRVVSAVTRQPVANVDVICYGDVMESYWQTQNALQSNSAPRQAARTDAQGRFSLRGVKPGSNVIAFIPPAPHAKLLRKFDVTGDGPLEDIELAMGSTLIVEVVEQHTGRRIAGSEIAINHQDSLASERLGGTTDARGIAVFESLEHGRYTIRSENNSYETVSVKLPVENVTITIGTSTLRGRVLRNGHPVPATVSGWVFPDPAKKRTHQFSSFNVDSDGRFELKSQLAGSRVVLEIRPTGDMNKALCEELHFPQSGDLERDFHLPTGIIKGRVLDAAGIGIANVEVKAQELESSEYRGAMHTDAYSRTTDAGGNFTFESLIPGRHRFSATPEGMSADAEEALVPFDGEQRIVLVLDSSETGQLIVNVTSESGMALDQFTVGLSVNNQQVQSAKSESIGPFTMTGIPAGTYYVTVGREGYQSGGKQNVEIKKGEATPLSIALQPGGRFSWRIETREGLLTSYGLNLSLTPIDGHPNEIRYFSGNPATSPYLRPGRYMLRAKYGDDVLVEEEIEIRPGETTEVNRRGK